MDHSTKNLTERFRISITEYEARPPIPPDEQAVVIQRAQGGDAESMQALIESNLRFIWMKALKYAGSQYRLTISDEDLLQSAILGFVEGVQRFRAEKGYRLLTYVDHWIKNDVLLAMLRESEHGGLNRTDWNSLPAVRRALHQWQDAHPSGDSPSVEEMMKITGQRRAVVESSLRVLLEGSLPLDKAIDAEDSGSSSLGDVISDPESSVEDQVIRRDVSAISRYLDRLLPWHRRLIEECVLPEKRLTIFQFARKYRLRPESVARHLRYAMMIIRAHYLRDGYREAK